MSLLTEIHGIFYREVGEFEVERFGHYDLGKYIKLQNWYDTILCRGFSAVKNLIS
jgi:hypothetical protein